MSIVSECLYVYVYGSDTAPMINSLLVVLSGWRGASCYNYIYLLIYVFNYEYFIYTEYLLL